MGITELDDAESVVDAILLLVGDESRSRTQTLALLRTKLAACIDQLETGMLHTDEESKALADLLAKLRSIQEMSIDIQSNRSKIRLCSLDAFRAIGDLRRALGQKVAMGEFPADFGDPQFQEDNGIILARPMDPNDEHAALGVLKKNQLKFLQVAIENPGTFLRWDSPEISGKSANVVESTYTHAKSNLKKRGFHGVAKRMECRHSNSADFEFRLSYLSDA